MALFSYKGIDSSGKEVKANINSESINMAKSKLRSSGIMLISIKEQKSNDKQSTSTGITFGSGVSSEDLSLMTRQLATLIKAKVQIVEALSALVDQAEKPKLKVVLSEIRQKVNEGTSLAKAFGDYPKIFDNVYINMVDAGEASGTLDIVLLRLADFKEKQVDLARKIKGAMTYPAIMVAVGFVMMMIIFLFVIPKITKIFVSMKKDLPLQTEICIWISEFLKSYWWGVIGGIFLGYSLFRKYIETEKGKKRWHSLLLKLPIIGEIVTMINASRFSSTLATLLNSSVPILASLEIVKNLISNVHMQKVVGEARDFVKEGSSMTIPLINSKLYPSMMTHMIKLGERSGELEPMLKIVAENYEDQVEAKLNGLTSVLEPIMMVCMGIAVAFIVFAVVVPMMELNSLSR